MANLLEPITIGGKLPLRNRIAMGSMTRNRCIDDNKPDPSQIKYYADRAKYSTGLIVTEGTFVDWTGCDWKHAPFMVTKEHADAWRKVTGAVHDVGGKIFFQAWHAGRCQHDQLSIIREKGGKVLAPSVIKAQGGKYRDLPGMPRLSTPTVPQQMPLHPRTRRCNRRRRGAETAPGSGEFFGPLPHPEGYPLPPGYDPVLDFGKLVKFPGSPTLLMANHNYTVETANTLVEAGKLDMITFARAFIWNADLVSRIAHGIPLAENDRGPWVFYGLEETPDEGYNDWPVASTA
ncbi:hypothetical protein FVER53263_12667 [Fusarium verticillioides]|nr:hypothetical protein FVER53263_12667 [Fusarium verticillioides]